MLAELAAFVGVPLPVTAAREYPTPGALYNTSRGLRVGSIAVVGIGCRLPGGFRSPAEYWRLLCTGQSGVREVPAERWDVAKFVRDNGSAHEFWGPVTAMLLSMFADVSLFLGDAFWTGWERILSPNAPARVREQFHNPVILIGDSLHRLTVQIREGLSDSTAEKKAREISDRFLTEDLNPILSGLGWNMPLLLSSDIYAKAEFKEFYGEVCQLYRSSSDFSRALDLCARNYVGRRMAGDSSLSFLALF